MQDPIELPVVAPATTERADAARNRERILCSARRLFAERGPDCVSMDEIAEAAGVGKGTLFRRFGSRAALAHAVLDEHERAFQEAFIRGAPPLGPGAPPVDRLIAFGEGRLEFLAEHADVLAAAEAGPARFSSPPTEVHRLHLRLLLGEADPDCDVDYLAEVLLATLTVALFAYLGEARELALPRLKAGWTDLVCRITGEQPHAAGGDAAPGAGTVAAPDDSGDAGVVPDPVAAQAAPGG
jgi:AcrR family transcriptional regulator